MKRNPFIPRIRHVAKTYPDWVTYKVAQGWAEANGRHELRERIEEYEKRGDLSGPELVDTLLEPSSANWGAAGRNTAFDRHLPWAAKALNSELKIWRKAAKRVGAPTEVFSRGYAGESGEPEVQPGSILARWQAGNTITGEQDRLRRDYLRATDAVGYAGDRVTYQLRVIAGWADAEDVDLTQFDSVVDAMTEANEYWSTRAPDREAVAGTVVYKFPDGWTVQELTTEEQFKFESDVMQHCVEEYCPTSEADIEGDCPVCGMPRHEETLNLDGDPVRIYSLRDPQGNPHSTMEWSDVEVYAVQVRGKQNDMPKAEYLRRLVCFRLDVLQPYLKVPVLKKMGQTLSPTAAVWEGTFGPEAQSYDLDRDVANKLRLKQDATTRAAIGSRYPATITLEEQEPGHVAVYADEDLDKAERALKKEYQDPSDMEPTYLPHWAVEDEAIAFPIWLDARSGDDGQMMVSPSVLTRARRAGQPDRPLWDDTEDEMVAALAFYDWETDEGYIGRQACELARAANPRRGRRMAPDRRRQDLKRKLMR